MEQMETIEKDINGLKVRYELPNGNKRQYKYNGLVEPARKLKIPDLNKTVENVKLVPFIGYFKFKGAIYVKVYLFRI